MLRRKCVQRMLRRRRRRRLWRERTRGDATETWRSVQREIVCVRERKHKTKPVKNRYVKMRADLHVSLRYRLIPKSSFVQRYATLQFPLQIYIPRICPTRHASARRRSQKVKYLLCLQRYAQPLTLQNQIIFVSIEHVYTYIKLLPEMRLYLQ